MGLRKILILFLLVAIAAPSLALTEGTRQNVVADYIDAVNSRDRGKLLSLVHPGCLESLTELEKRFLIDVWVPGEFRNQIPLTARIKENALSESEIPFASILAWKVNPSKRVQIDFEKAAYHEVTIVRWTAQLAGKEYFVFGFPKGEFLAMALENAQNQARDADAKK